MGYRIICCSDTHGKIPPQIDETGAIAWLHGGDVSNGPDILDLETSVEEDFLLAPVSRWFVERSIPVHLVSGNHDIEDVFRCFSRCGDLSGKMVKLADRLFVAGIGWHGERYYELPLEADLAPVCQSVIRQGLRILTSQDRLILLTHYPPRFSNTEHVENDRDGGGVWYDCVKSVVELLEPIVVVQGHNHNWFRRTHLVQLNRRPVLILNPGPTGCVLTVELDATPSEVQYEYLENGR
jgi:Icc-related predicted phosphoesterase